MELNTVRENICNKCRDEYKSKMQVIPLNVNTFEPLPHFIVLTDSTVYRYERVENVSFVDHCIFVDTEYNSKVDRFLLMCYRTLVINPDSVLDADMHQATIINNTKSDKLFYNEKKFLVEDSILSASMYQAKMYEDGEYKFRIHDCIGGIRLRGNILKEEKGLEEAKAKFKTLREGIERFEAYLNTL